MSRSSVLYGPFSIVWGIGVVVLTMMLHKYRDRDDRYIFIFGTVVGGAYEYVCSVFTEMVFGTVFWDYSKIPFNLGGRINLLYCFFWGLASVLWIKNVYPFLSRWIEKVPEKVGKILSWVFLVFMTVNIVLSGMALARYSDRYGGKPAEKPAYRSKKQRAQQAKMRADLRSLEQQLDKMQEELDTLTAELTDEAVCSDYQLMQEKCQRMEELRVQMDETMEQMILLEEELG